LVNLLHCNAMNFDSFSLGARHLFQNVVLFKKKKISYMRLHMSYIVVFKIKISFRISKKKYLGSLTLKHFGFYVNLVRHFIAYSQPFNLVYR
jgi:hypothetical protein